MKVGQSKLLDLVAPDKSAVVQIATVKTEELHPNCDGNCYADCNHKDRQAVPWHQANGMRGQDSQRVSLFLQMAGPAHRGPLPRRPGLPWLGVAWVEHRSGRKAIVRVALTLKP